MSDHTPDNEFDRDLALTSRAYKNAESELPPTAMDDAIRAAARRAVKSQPHAIHKSWISRWSTPISAAALIVLTVSVGLIAIDEQPDQAPALLKEVARPKLSTPPAAPSIPAPAATPRPASESTSPAAAVVLDSPQPARAAEKKARLDLQSAAPRDQIAESTKPESDQRRNEVGLAASGNLLAKDADRAVASPPVAPFVPAPPPAKLAVRQDDTNQSAAAETTKREMPRAVGAAIASRPEVSEPMLQKKSVAASAPAPASMPPRFASAGARSVAPPVYAPPAAPLSLADKLSESPEVWMKRILELKRLERTREFEEELAKFRKRYPDFALPQELKVPR
jgi:hypothetical protein